MTRLLKTSCMFLPLLILACGNSSTTNSGNTVDVDPAKSTVTASPDTGIPADGVHTFTITVTLIDTDGNPVVGTTLLVSDSPGNGDVWGNNSDLTTDDHGVVSTTLASTTAETKTITVKYVPLVSSCNLCPNLAALLDLSAHPTIEFVAP